MELKTLLPQRPSKELVPEAMKKITPTIVVPTKTKMTEKELETPKTISSKPSPQQRSTKKKKKGTYFGPELGRRRG